jgi:hypothetical protein
LIGDVANSQVRHDDVKFGVLEWKVLRVRLGERCLRRALPCERQHRRREIDADDLAAAAQQRLGDVALSTTQIECAAARSGSDGVNRLPIA